MASFKASSKKSERYSDRRRVSGKGRESSKGKLESKSTLKLKIKKRDAAVLGLVVVGIVVVLFYFSFSMLYPSQTNPLAPAQVVHGSVRFVPPQARTILFAGYNTSHNTSHNTAHIDFGNKEGITPGVAAKYTVPPTIDQGRIVLVGSWRVDPDQAVHVGTGEGFFFAGFNGSWVAVEAARELQGSPALVFYDGKYATPEVVGNDVRIQEGRALMFVDANASYSILKNIPEGLHLVGIVTKSDGFSIKSISFG